MQRSPGSSIAPRARFVLALGAFASVCGGVPHGDSYAASGCAFPRSRKIIRGGAF
jgi:hypothetical protein